MIIKKLNDCYYKNKQHVPHYPHKGVSTCLEVFKITLVQVCLISVGAKLYRTVTLQEQV